MKWIMSNPFYRYDPGQCILCGRCVEACQNLQVNETLSINWEDAHPRVLWDGGAPIGESSCVSCGHCVTVCPCNALMEKSMLGEAGYFTALPKPALDGMIDVVKGIEPEIGYGSILQLSEVEAAMRESPHQAHQDRLHVLRRGLQLRYLDQRPAHSQSGAGAGTGQRHLHLYQGQVRLGLCEQSRPPYQAADSRGQDSFREATWDEALALVARRFAEIKAATGPDSLAFISSSKCTNEESYLMQKLARAVIGTNNMDNCSRYCQAPATTGLFRTVGYGGDSGSISDIEQAGLVLIIGSNTAESHPVLATRVKRAHKLRGQKLIVSDLREHEMARRADVFLHPRPGTDLIWLSAVTRYIFENGLAKPAFIEKWVNGARGIQKEPRSLHPGDGQPALRTARWKPWSRLHT